MGSRPHSRRPLGLEGAFVTPIQLLLLAGLGSGAALTAARWKRGDLRTAAACGGEPFGPPASRWFSTRNGRTWRRARSASAAGRISLPT
jgi:hypothetical protein